jgi:hypothetical protein
MYYIKFFKQVLYDDIKFFLVNFNNLLIKGKFGKIKVNLYLYGFINYNNSLKINFLFINKLIYSNFLRYFFKLYSFVLKLYFFRLRLKGLGYRMFKINVNLYKFFFAKNHFYYFYVPIYSYVKVRRRNFFIMSFNKMLLNQLFHHFMLLKKLDLYEKTNSFILKNKILFIKKRK